MSTAYQQRLKMLWEGNPLANFRIPEQEDTVAPLPPTAYQSTEKTNAAADVRSPVGFQTQQITPRTSYQDVIRQRFGSINALGAGPTQAAMAAQQMRAQQVANSTYQGPSPSNVGGTATGLTGNAERDALMKLVAKQKGMPYSWGGGNSKGPSYGLSGGGERHGSSKIYGFDCSGLVQYAYAQIGIKLPRGGNAQLASGYRIPLKSAAPGDLVGKPGHIAIYAGNGMMWEAPTFGKQVRLAPVRAGMFAVRVKGVG